MEYLRVKVHRMKLERFVIFWGTSKSVGDLLAAMDVFVFPSLTEGFGIAAVEAQASGLITVCSERVPEEVLLTPWAFSLPLSSGPKKWADEIRKQTGIEDRSYAANYIKKAGLDREYIVDQVWNELLDEKHGD